MLPKIALEEHFITPALLPYLLPALPQVTEADKATVAAAAGGLWRGTPRRHGCGRVAKSVLSVSGPGVQTEPDTAIATRLASDANDVLAAEIAKQPNRYAGFAHVALQDPKAAADELERCVRDLGFCGVMVNHHTNGVYLDAPGNDVFWERLQALDVPLYLHPAMRLVMPHVLQGGAGAGKAGVGMDHGDELPRLAAGDDRRVRALPPRPGDSRPAGETLPYMLWRLTAATPSPTPTAACRCRLPTISAATSP